MASSTDRRRQEVLRAIVADYIASHEPVGSKALVDRHSLGVSPATIRNDMAALEDEGLIAAPHTSSTPAPDGSPRRRATASSWTTSTTSSRCRRRRDARY